MQYSEKFKKDCIILGQNIKQLRESKNMTLNELSQKTKISLNYLKKIESGNAYGVKILTHLAKIASALDLKLHEIFCDI